MQNRSKQLGISLKRQLTILAGTRCALAQQQSRGGCATAPQRPALQPQVFTDVLYQLLRGFQGDTVEGLGEIR